MKMVSIFQLVVVIYVIVVLWLVSANFRSTLTSLSPRNVISHMSFPNSRDDGELESLIVVRYVISFAALCSARNLEMSIGFSLKSRLSERFHRPEMSQIKAEISLRTNLKLICHKNVGLQ